MYKIEKALISREIKAWTYTSNLPGLSFNPKEINPTQTGRSPGSWINALLLLPVSSLTVDSYKDGFPFTVAGPRWNLGIFDTNHADHQTSLLTSADKSVKTCLSTLLFVSLYCMMKVFEIKTFKLLYQRFKKIYLPYQKKMRMKSGFETQKEAKFFPLEKRPPTSLVN